MKVKKIMLTVLLAAIVVVIILAIAILNKKQNENRRTEKLNVVVTSFSAYDFVSHIGEDKLDVEFLLQPGVDSHSYEPTAQDLIKIQNSDIFIYIGGELEGWTEKVLNSLDTSNTKVYCLLDTVKISEEQEIDGAEEHEHREEYDDEEHEEKHDVEYDEHIWTSPANAIIMVQKLAELVSEKDEENKQTYEQNAEKYVNEIIEVQDDIKQVVASKVRDRLVFGDKMPMQYFLTEFGLTSTAAFAGCSTETEPSSSTIAYITRKVKEEQIPVILYIELSSGTVAKTIAEETGAEAIQIQTLHNISKDDFDNGETYVSLMRRNIDVLKKALF